MIKKNFIKFLKTLKPEDWKVKINSQWTVKDIVAHMVGWEKGDVKIIPECWKNNTKPWFLETEEFDDFNRESIKYYNSYTPKKLIAEWEKWQKKVKAEIDRIGKKDLQSRREFRWLFEDEDKKPRKHLSHYEHHYKQIKFALKSNSNAEI
jgi:hypothetical protein